MDLSVQTGGVVRVREETRGDYGAVDAVARACFLGPGNDPPAEVALVRAIRQLPDFDSRLSLVAEHEGQVMGHLLFSPMSIEAEGGSVPALALAPLAVLPGFEATRAGTLLMREGLRRCREAGHRVVIVLGHPRYYRRFGFRPARALGILPPDPAWNDTAFMALALEAGALDGVHGTARYSPPFDAAS
jgi:putative acetyltransferase